MYITYSTSEDEEKALSINVFDVIRAKRDAAAAEEKICMYKQASKSEVKQSKVVHWRYTESLLHQRTRPLMTE